MDSFDLPRISIITPSFNQGHYLEETIWSVLEQGYSNLEYIIIDGGSRDNSADIIRKYESHLAYWVSEPDKGQTHAINKGLAKATGDIIAYLNSDDTYCPGALEAVAAAYNKHPDAGLFHGTCNFIEADGSFRSAHTASIKNFQEVVDIWGYWWNKKQFVQPEVFWTRKVLEKVGGFNEDLYFVMDVDFWIRTLKEGFGVVTIPQPLANFRFHEQQKSGLAERSAAELQYILRPYLYDISSPLPSGLRRQLCGNWVFDNKLLPVIKSNQSRTGRYWNVLRSLVANPVLFESPRFRKHLKTVFHFDN